MLTNEQMKPGRFLKIQQGKRTIYESALPFATKREAMAHLDLFEYKAMPLRNRYTNRSIGDFGEARIGFAHIEKTGKGYIVHEVDMPLKRG